MPRLTFYFAEDFPDRDLADTHYKLEAPGDEHGHGDRGEWVIGRSPTNDLTISLRNVSRRHLMVSYSYVANAWYVTDLGSTSGTTLSGRMLVPHDPTPITPGDRLWLGPNPIYCVEDEGDTLGTQADDDGPPTVADVVPLDYRPTPPPPPPPPPSAGWADAAAIALQWLTTPKTGLGVAARLLVVATVTVVVVIIFEE